MEFGKYLFLGARNRNIPHAKEFKALPAGRLPLKTYGINEEFNDFGSRGGPTTIGFHYDFIGF